MYISNLVSSTATLKVLISTVRSSCAAWVMGFRPIRHCWSQHCFIYFDFALYIHVSVFPQDNLTLVLFYGLKDFLTSVMLGHVKCLFLRI